MFIIIIYIYLVEHDILCEHQSGFRATHSTVTIGIPSSRLEKAKNYLSIYTRLAKAKN